MAAEGAEAAHWDSIATTHGDAYAAREHAGAGDPLHEAHIRALGPVAGCLVLDLGCGMGLWTTELASHGARVVALDVSSASVSTVWKRAQRFGLSEGVEPVTASAHALPFADSSFDLVTGHLILHHLDASVAGREVARVLRPGGRAVFTENSARSGTLMLARKHLCGRFGIPRWSTPDEYPLRRSDLRLLRASFAQMTTIYPRFDWFFLLNAKLFGFRNLRASRLLDRIDRTVAAVLPFMRRLAYYQIIVLQR
jgi:ubiquinone/menaquinone biosynthesis C-methylase UbiE